MTTEQFQAALKAAYAADDAFQAACELAGYRSRWDMPAAVKRDNAAVSRAYDAKVKADAEMHLAFEQMRMARHD